MASISWVEGSVYRTDSVNSTVTPGYAEKKANHEILPDNAYSHYGEWQGSAYHSVLRQAKANGSWSDGLVYTSFIKAPGIALPAYNYAEWDMAFLAKVKQASVSVITMMAERKQTATLLTEFASKILYTVTHWRSPRKVVQVWLGPQFRMRKWKSRSLDRAIARCTGPADAWLHYRFAIRPMIYDIRDALEAFEKGSKKQHTFRVTRTGKFGGVKVTPDVGPFGTLDGIARLEGRFKIAGRFRVSDPSTAALGNLASVSASLWDLVPFSFVVDWAWDISSYLDLSNATLGLSYVSGFKSVKRTYRREYKTHISRGADERFIPLDSYPAIHVSKYFYRDKMTSCPTPYIRMGTVSSIFGDGHIYDMLSLARQRYLLGKNKTYYFDNPTSHTDYTD